MSVKNRNDNTPLPAISITATVLLGVLIFIVFNSVCRSAYAGTRDRFGSNAEVYSVTITPRSVTAGTYPEIIGFVQNASTLKNKKKGSAVFDVTALITYPDGTQKSYLWRNVNFTASQKKSYLCPNSYDIRQIGVYKITYSVYNGVRTHLYASNSGSFTVSSPSVIARPAPSPETKSKAPETAKTIQPSKAPVPAELRSEHVQKTLAPDTGKPALAEAKAVSGERQVMGIGAYVNTLNFSGGPNLVIWPLRNLALQGTYGVGSFTSYEARMFYRFVLSERVHPYLGAGYLHAERSAHVLGVAVRIADDGYTAFGGVELPLTKTLSGYIDVSGTSLKLKKEVDNGTSQATATVNYSPVTVSTGLVFYLF